MIRRLRRIKVCPEIQSYFPRFLSVFFIHLQKRQFRYPHIAIEIHFHFYKVFIIFSFKLVELVRVKLTRITTHRTCQLFSNIRSSSSNFVLPNKLMNSAYKNINCVIITRNYFVSSTYLFFPKCPYVWPYKWYRSKQDVPTSPSSLNFKLENCQGRPF